MSKEELQQKYLELQEISTQLKQLQQQISNLEAQLMEMQKVKETLADLEKLNSKKDILVPVANGVYAKAELNQNQNVLINIGADLIVEKNFGDAKKIIEEQIEEINKLIGEMNIELKNGAIGLQYMQKEFQEISSKT